MVSGLICQLVCMEKNLQLSKDTFSPISTFIEAVADSKYSWAPNSKGQEYYYWTTFIFKLF